VFPILSYSRISVSDRWRAHK